MGLKRQLTPLNRIERLDDSAIRVLRDAGITTVEELLGYIESDPEGTGKLLGLSGEETDALLRECRSVLAPATAEALDDQSGTEYPLGAWPAFGEKPD